MKTSRLLAVLAVSVLSIAVVTVDGAAQVTHPTATRPAAAHPTAARPTVTMPKIALLDLGYIFKNHSGFKSMKTDMDARIKAAEAWVKEERGNLLKLAEGRNEYRPGTIDRKALDEEIAQREASLAVRVRLQRKEFLQMESKIYHTVYQEVVQQVDYYCRSNGIALVMRFTGESSNGDDPQRVMSDINKPLIWHDRSLDITGIILQQLNSRRDPRIGTQPSSGHGVPRTR